MAPVNNVLVPFNGQLLALPEEQYREALARGVEFAGTVQCAAAESGPVSILTAEGMESVTNIPAGWFLEHARQGDIPHIRAGKYVRFNLREVLEVLKAHPRHADRLSVVLPKQ